jgi:hypothetical protein
MPGKEFHGEGPEVLMWMLISSISARLIVWLFVQRREGVLLRLWFRQVAQAAVFSVGRMAKNSSIDTIVLSIAADVGQVLSDLRPHSPKTSVPRCRSGQRLPSEQQGYFTLELQNHFVNLKVYT